MNASPLACLLLLLAPLAARDAGAAQEEAAPARDAAPLYPAERHPTVLHYFALVGEVDGEVLQRALAALDAQGRARILEGPVACSTRPRASSAGTRRAPRARGSASSAALRRACSEVEPLSATSFETSDGPLPGILAYSARDCIVGMADEMRWFEEREGRRTFWFVSGKLAAEDVAKRFRRLYEPFGHPEVGRLVEHPLSWALAAPIDTAAARKAERAIAKLPGVLSARIDPKAATLEARVAIDAVRQTLPGGGEREGAVPARLRWPTNALLDVLAEHGLAPPGAGGPAAGRGATGGER